MKSFLFKISLLSLFWILFSCQNQPQLIKIEGEQIAVDSTLSQDQSLEKFIKPYRTSIQEEMNRPLSYTKKAMFKSDHPLNTAIGNMMADAVFEMANPIFNSRHKDSIDGVLLNYGGIRSGINQGVITTRTAYNIMPFENMVVVAELDAKSIKAMVNYLAKNQVAHPISKMQLRLNSNSEVVDFKINGKPINDDETYFIATSDYLLQGGDNMIFFKNATQVFDIDYKLRNLFIDYFKKHDTISATADQRFVKIR
ncbi:5'-nucleotidase C-terminal domain-containing protein [Psychroflexus sp. MBR-150]|jgi:2',3'-cyclic-nucleotide 2'-phosphodiesterase (5'-nucleotidase family)